VVYLDILEFIQKAEEIYKKFMISDNTPDLEADLKIQLLETLSSMLAFCKLKKGEQAEALKTMINSLKDKLLSWDPYGPWFKENKELSTGVYDLITQAKMFKFAEEVLPSNIVTSEEFNNFKNSIQNEFQSIKKAINLIKQSITSLGSVRPPSKPVIRAPPKPAPKPVSTPSDTPILTVVSKPEPKKAPVPKPVPLDTPTPESKPAPTSKPLVIPKPVPITEVPMKTPTEPEYKGSELTSVLSAKKKVEKKDSSKLFGLFSKPTTEEVQTKPITPAPSGFKSVSMPKTVSTPIPKLVPIQPAQVKPTVMKSVTPMKTVTPKPVSVKPIEITPEPSTTESTTPQPGDAEVLYHELISLQGKRYGLERSIKELKALHQSGSMTEAEYKQKLSAKLEELKKISAKIERIREKLE